MTTIALGAGDSKSEHFQHAGIALVEIERHNLGIAIDPQCKLR